MKVRILHQEANRKPQILGDTLKPRRNPNITDLVPRDADIAERACGRSSRFRGVKAALLEIARSHGAVKLDLLSELGFESPMTDRVPDAPEERSHRMAIQCRGV